MSLVATPVRVARIRLTREEHDKLFRMIAVDPQTGCWHFTRSLSLLVWFRGETQLIHRLLYQHFKGALRPDEELCLGDRCPNKRCVAPDHRFVS